jgi:hypothetical protein
MSGPHRRSPGRSDQAPTTVAGPSIWAGARRLAAHNWTALAALTPSADMRGS